MGKSAVDEIDKNFLYHSLGHALEVLASRESRQSEVLSALTVKNTISGIFPDLNGLALRRLADCYALYLIDVEVARGDTARKATEGLKELLF